MWDEHAMQKHHAGSLVLNTRTAQASKIAVTYENVGAVGRKSHVLECLLEEAPSVV